MEMNSLIYKYEEDNYKMYKINKIDKNNPNVFQCSVQGNIEIEFDEARDMNWSKVGVFKEGATGEETVLINRDSIHGKVLKLSSLLITCPNNLLNEK